MGVRKPINTNPKRRRNDVGRRNRRRRRTTTTDKPVTASSTRNCRSVRRSSRDPPGRWRGRTTSAEVPAAGATAERRPTTRPRTVRWRAPGRPAGHRRRSTASRPGRSYLRRTSRDRITMWFNVKSDVHNSSTFSCRHLVRESPRTDDRCDRTSKNSSDNGFSPRLVRASESVIRWKLLLNLWSKCVARFHNRIQTICATNLKQRDVTNLKDVESVAQQEGLRARPPPGPEKKITEEKWEKEDKEKKRN